MMMPLFLIKSKASYINLPIAYNVAAIAPRKPIT